MNIIPLINKFNFQSKRNKSFVSINPRRIENSDISKLCNCNSEIINVKAKTADKVGTIGKSKAIACWVTVTITE